MTSRPKKFTEVNLDLKSYDKCNRSTSVNQIARMVGFFLQRIVAGWFPRHTPWPANVKHELPECLHAHRLVCNNPQYFRQESQNQGIHEVKVGYTIFRLNLPNNILWVENLSLKMYLLWSQPIIVLRFLSAVWNWFMRRGCRRLVILHLIYASIRWRDCDEVACYFWTNLENIYLFWWARFFLQYNCGHIFGKRFYNYSFTTNPIAE